MIEAAYIASGAVVGLLVGMTGVGGGSLMTPLLVLAFGFAPAQALGTDLLYASATKAAGTAVHGRHGTVDWPVVARLSAGSLPVAALTLIALAHWQHAPQAAGVLVGALACVIVATGVALIAKQAILQRLRRLTDRAGARFARLQAPMTMVAGGVLGFLVALTSIGAGALGAVMLTALYPRRLAGSRLVGTDLAHAIPLTLVAGSGHFLLGNIDLPVLGLLLAGSSPGVIVGSLAGIRMPERMLRSFLGLLLMLIGARLLA